MKTCKMRLAPETMHVVSSTGSSTGTREGQLTAPDHIVRLIGASRNDVFNVYVASASQQESPDFFAAVQNFASSDDQFLEPYNTTGGRIRFSVQYY